MEHDVTSPFFGLYSDYNSDNLIQTAHGWEEEDVKPLVVESWVLSLCINYQFSFDSQQREREREREYIDI